MLVPFLVEFQFLKGEFLKTRMVTGLMALTLFCVAAQADIFDRINDCERIGGGTCVFDLMREMARTKPGGGHTLLEGGTYFSEQYSITVSSTMSSVFIEGGSEIGERGTYQCSQNSCTGAGHTLTIQGRDRFQMGYGRVWTRKP